MAAVLDYEEEEDWERMENTSNWGVGIRKKSGRGEGEEKDKYLFIHHLTII